MNTSTALRQEVDHHFSGYLVPDILFSERGPTQRLRGILHAVNEEKGYGFLTAQTGLGMDTMREDIFCTLPTCARPEAGWCPTRTLPS